MMLHNGPRTYVINKRGCDDVGVRVLTRSKGIDELIVCESFVSKVVCASCRYVREKVVSEKGGEVFNLPTQKSVAKMRSSACTWVMPRIGG